MASKIIFREDINKIPDSNNNDNKDNKNKNKNKKVVAYSVHIRNQQRNGRKSITTITGLEDDLDLEKIVKYMRKIFSTNGTILQDDEMGDIIQLQGDCRFDARDFLVKFNICNKDDIKVHGAMF